MNFSELWYVNILLFKYRKMLQLRRKATVLIIKKEVGGCGNWGSRIPRRRCRSRTSRPICTLLGRTGCTTAPVTRIDPILFNHGSLFQGGVNGRETSLDSAPEWVQNFRHEIHNNSFLPLWKLVSSLLIDLCTSINHAIKHTPKRGMLVKIWATTHLTWYPTRIITHAQKRK